MKRRMMSVIAILLLGAGISLFVVRAEKMSFPQPEPRPVPPPPGLGLMDSPMARLSQSQNFSASRVSSHQRQGGPRDNYWIPTTGEEITLAEIKGPGAITHIWTTHRSGGHDLIIRMYWEGSGYPSVEAPIGDFSGRPKPLISARCI